MVRCRVIAHMYVSIDGKIDGRYMEEKGCDESGEYYETVIWEMGEAMAGGRVTNVLYHAFGKIDLSEFEETEVPDGDYVIPCQRYNFCFDRKGRSFWNSNQLEYGGKNMQNVSVLSDKVEKGYLAYLRHIGVSYIICADLREALYKIKTLFGVNTLVLTGGATINGGFHKEGLLDELSLVMAPYIEGNHDYKGYAEANEYIGYKYVYKSIKPLGDGGIHLLFERR